MSVIHPFRATVAAALLLAASGCGKSSATKSAAGHDLPLPLVAQCEPGRPSGRLTLVTTGVPRTFNPVIAMDGASDAVTRLLFGSLVNLDMATQETGPGLAESWSVAPDQKTWTFKLRAGLRWSDGEPLTADDVVFTWNEVMYNPEMNQATYGVFLVDGKRFSISKVDNVTVRVVTPEVFAPLVEYFGSVVILPRHTFGPFVQARRFVTAYHANTPPEKIVGCGPFRVKDVQAGKYVLLERNPEYWMADKQGRRLPYLDEVMIVAGDSGAPMALLLAGKNDVFEQCRSEQYDSVKQAAAAGRFRIEELGVGADRDFLWFNQNTGADSTGKPFVPPGKLKWFRDKKFRQAVSCALDRDRLVREVYGGRAQAIYTFASAESRKWYNANMPLYAHDAARARSLLAEIGLEDRNGDGVLEDADGTPVEFTLFTNAGNPFRERAAALVVEDLKKIGVKADLKVTEFQSLIERINGTFDYDCMLMGLGGGGADPASQMNVLKSDEALHQWFPNQTKPSTAWEARVDELMNAQMRTLDFAQRKKLFDQVQSILAEELPMISTVAPFHFAAARADIGNLRPSAATPYNLTWNVQELYFKK
jgi:peptide/nickel transport system substrate-binding protein